MQAARDTTVTVRMSEQEARDLAFTISEALWGLQLPQQDGFPFNWKGDPRTMKDFYNQIKPADWGDIP